MTGGGLKPSEIIEAGGSGPEGLTELKYRAHVAFSTMYEIVGNLEKVHNRRKALVWVSDGYDFNPFQGARYGDPNVVGQKPVRRARIRGSESSSNTDYDPFSSRARRSTTRT